MEKGGARPHRSRRLATVQKELVAELLIISAGALRHLGDLLSIKLCSKLLYTYIFFKPASFNSPWAPASQNHFPQVPFQAQQPRRPYVYNH